MIVYLKRQMNWLFSFIAKIDFNLSAFKLKIQQSLPEAEHIPGREVQELPSQRLIFQMCLSIKSFPFAMTKSHYHTHPRSYKWWLRSTETSNVVTREPALDSKASKSNLHHELVPETHSTQPTQSSPAPVFSETSLRKEGPAFPRLTCQQTASTRPPYLLTTESCRIGRHTHLMSVPTYAHTCTEQRRSLNLNHESEMTLNAGQLDRVKPPSLPFSSQLWWGDILCSFIHPL